METIFAAYQVREYCEAHAKDLPETEEPRTPRRPRGGHPARILSALVGFAARLLPPAEAPELEPARVPTR